MLNRLIRALYGDISKDEIKKFSLLAITFFFVIGSYWLLRPLKDGLFFSIVGGKDWQPLAKMFSVVNVLVFVMIYNKLVDMFEKHKLFYIIGTFYAVIFFVVAYLLGHPTIGLANTVASPYRYLGWFTYLAIESFGSLMVALFWSFVSSITEAGSAKKGFALILGGAQTGAIIGPAMATNAQTFGLRFLFVLAACGIVAVMLMIRYFMRVMPASELVGNKSAAATAGKPKTSFMEGLRLIATRLYLFGILIVALRLASPKKSFTGASNPGSKRLNEFVLGFVNAVRERPCFNIPPIK